MTARAKKAAEPVLVTGWIPCTTAPVRDGVYDLTGNVNINVLHPVRVNHSGGRWFRMDGSPFFRDGDDELADWSWRGRRMWVLRDKIGLYLTGLRPVHTFKLDLAFARPFKTERQAQRFAARYSHLGMTAVLP